MDDLEITATSRSCLPRTTVENAVACNSGAASDGEHAAISLEKTIENGVDHSGRTAKEIVTETPQHHGTLVRAEAGTPVRTHTDTVANHTLSTVT